jgi:Helix-hairpin-helix domain
MESKTEKIELLRCVMNGEGTHLPGTILDVPEADVPEYLEKKVGRLVEGPAADLPLSSAPGTLLKTEAGLVDTSTGEVLQDDANGSGEGDDAYTLLVADLQTIPGVTEEIAETLIGYGVESKEQLGQYSVEDLITVEGVTEEIAKGIVAALVTKAQESDSAPAAPKTKPAAPQKGKGKVKGKAKA